jgi:hypothetical protein
MDNRIPTKALYHVRDLIWWTLYSATLNVKLTTLDTCSIVGKIAEMGTIENTTAATHDASIFSIESYVNEL